MKHRFVVCLIAGVLALSLTACGSASAQLQARPTAGKDAQTVVTMPVKAEDSVCAVDEAAEVVEDETPVTAEELSEPETPQAEVTPEPETKPLQTEVSQEMPEPVEEPDVEPVETPDEQVIEKPAEPEPQPEEPEPEITVPTEELKRQVAQYAAQYINQYRTEAGVPACTVLSGMTRVAEYRADQLTYNYSHSTADKREALAYYQYGRWVDATLAGLTEADSYYEADSAEAICAGFKGSDAEALGAYIARLIRNSSSHWRYVGSSEYSYIGIGVEYREGSEYGWYACVMVGSVNYG